MKAIILNNRSWCVGGSIVNWRLPHVDPEHLGNQIIHRSIVKASIVFIYYIHQVVAKAETAVKAEVAKVAAKAEAKVEKKVEAAPPAVEKKAEAPAVAKAEAPASGFKLPVIDSGAFDGWLAAQLAASPEDPKSTDTFKYINFTEMPPFIDAHKSLMRKTLTPELWAKLKDVKSSKGYTLSNAIQAGVLRPHLGVGITAGDEECFELFKEIIYPVVKGWHKFDPETEVCGIKKA